LVTQVEKYQNPFSNNDLKRLFEKQVEKLTLHLTLHKTIPYQEDGSLFSNLLDLIKNTDKSDNRNILENNENLEDFIELIYKIELYEKIRAIGGFIFGVYFLASGELKEKIAKLLTDTYEETKKQEQFSEYSVVYAFNLYNIDKLLDDTELEYVLKQLKSMVENHLKEHSSHFHYCIIKKQLSKIDAEKLKSYQDVVENVTELSVQIEQRSAKTMIF